MNKEKVVIQTQLPHSVFVKLGLLAATKHLPRSAVVEKLLTEAFGKMYEAPLITKITREIQRGWEMTRCKDVRRFALLKDKWCRYLKNKKIPTDVREHILNQIQP